MIDAAFSTNSRFLAVSSDHLLLGKVGRHPSRIQLVSLRPDRCCPITPQSRSTWRSKYGLLPPDGRVVVVDGEDGSMNVYDQGGTLLWQAEEKGETVGKLVISASGRLVARLLLGKGWVVTDMATRQNILINDGGPLAFAPDEKRLLISSRIYTIDTKAAPQAITNAMSFQRLWFLSGSNLVIARQIRNNGVEAGPVLFDWRTGSVSDISEGSTFAISPDERRFAVLKDDVVEIWKIGASKPSVRSKPMGSAFKSSTVDIEEFLHFNQEGTLLAAAFSFSIHIYDADTLELKLKVPIPRGEQFAGFSLDGKYILTFRWQNGFPEPTLHPITLKGVIAETCAKAKRNLTSEEWSRYAPGATQQNTCP